MGDLTPAGRTPELPPDVAARIQQAAGKGQVALLVVDARGSLLVGIKGTGGMTEARHDAESGWTFRVHLGRGAQILDGSYVLRPVGDDRPDDFEDDESVADSIRAKTPPEAVKRIVARAAELEAEAPCPDCGNDPADETLHRDGCPRIGTASQFGPPWEAVQP